MTEKVTYTYIAYDGTVFDDKDECRAYEEEKIAIYTANGQKLPLTDEYLKNNATFINISDNFCLRKFQQFCEENEIPKNYIDLDSFIQPGFYIYNTALDNGTYYRYDEDLIDVAQFILGKEI